MSVRSLVAVLFGVGAVAAGQSLGGSAPSCAPGAAAAADSLAVRFDDHQFVLIGSTHGDAKIDEFLMCLVSRPAFTQRVTDIVAEWASSAPERQRLLDRHLLLLEDVTQDELSWVFLDTDAPTMWTTLPNVRQFVATLRDVNKTLPSAKRIRLVGGSDPTEWAKVRVVEDLAPYPFKTNFMTHLIPEHLARIPGNRTLVVYGDGHIRHEGGNFMGDVEAALGRDKFFVMGRIGELVASERPYLAAVGDPNKAFFVSARRFPSNMPSPPSLRMSMEERPTRLADYIDAFVYLGPEPDKDMTGSIPRTAAQRKEIDRRNSITADGQRAMLVRLQGRALWFRAHPNDFPARP